VLRTVAIWLLILFCLAPFAHAQEGTNETEPDLTPIKDYTLENVELMQEASTELVTYAQTYYDLLAEYDFDYEAAWETDAEVLTQLILDAQAQWLITSNHYELNEGIVAGVESLSYYDVWLDAGPSKEEDPENALEWTLELPDGTTLDSPGNFFHHLTEPALWGTNPDYVGLAVDFDEDGDIEVGEVLPEANMLLGSVRGLDEATAELVEALEAWEPTLEDAFSALVVMVPTMSEYFGQWKESVYIAEASESGESFVAVSRLADIHDILTGLALVYENLHATVEAQNPDLALQIQTEFDTLLTYVDDLYTQEQDGVRFTTEEADLYGSEAQDQANTLTALIAQAAAELNVTIPTAE
jgi:hypothetical protein